MTALRRLLCLAAAALACAIAPAGAGAQPPGAPLAALLQQSGARFPDRIGSFVRQRTGSVAPGRADAHYVPASNLGGAITLDVYLAAAEADPAAELAATEPVVASVIQELRSVRPLTAPPAAGLAAGKLWKGLIEGKPVFTAMLISRRGAWRIKLRATAAASLGDKGVAMIEQAFRDYPWWSGGVAEARAAH